MCNFVAFLNVFCVFQVDEEKEKLQLEFLAWNKSNQIKVAIKVLVYSGQMGITSCFMLALARFQVQYIPIECFS